MHWFWNKKEEPKHKKYVYKPLPDITAWESAKCLEVWACVLQEYPVIEAAIGLLESDPRIARHFEEMKE